MSATTIPKKQTVALVRFLGGPVEFDENYPVPVPGPDEVLAKVLYVGVCQSDLHTKNGTATGADGHPITAIKLPHIGGHEGIGRIIALGRSPNLLPSSQSNPSSPTIKIGSLVGIRFLARICHHCRFCTSSPLPQEQYCQNSTNHLHHHDGAFQQYIVLSSSYLTLLPDDCDPVSTGPVLCAGVTAYKAVKNADIRSGDWVVVVGAGGGLGGFAVQFAVQQGAKVLGIDSGEAKKRDIEERFGATRFVDYKITADVVGEVWKVTDGKGADAVVVTSGSEAAFSKAADMLGVGGTLCVCGIPPGGGHIETTVAAMAIKGLTVKGNLVGSLKECMEAVDLVRAGKVKPKVFVRPFRDLPKVYEELERGDIAGRVVLKIGDEDERGLSRL